MMKFVTFFVAITCWPLMGLADSGLKDPPHISGEVITKYTAIIGETLKLDCPIDSSLQPMYEWSKDGEAITTGWERFRVNGRKLRIRSVDAVDGGNYVCKAVNGFGSKEISTRVVIFDKNGKIVGGDEEKSQVKPSSGGTLAMRPIIVEKSQPKTPDEQTFRQQVGSSITLSCKVAGQPYPTVTWLKHNKQGGTQLSIGTGQHLDLTAVDFEDSGIYICLAVNEFGRANASFFLEVIDKEMGKPSIISLEPSNVTVARGRRIDFRCHISSDTIPNVKWLREVDENSLDSSGIEPVKMIKPLGQELDSFFPSRTGEFGNKKYKFIGSASELKPFSNGSYLSELTIKAERGASGAYICLVTNAAGHNNSTTILTLDGDPMLSTGMLVAIPSTLAILFAALALVMCCFRNRKSNGAGVVTTTTTYASPQDVIHNHQQQPVPHPFYNPGHHPPGRIIPNNFDRYLYKDASCPMKTTTANHTSPNAYASVRICEVTGPPNSTFAPNRAPPLPTRPNFAPNTRDRNNYNACHGLLTQPLLTQTASSSDSRDSRQSASGRVDFANSNHRQIDHWGSSGGSDASSDRKHSRSRYHQVNL